MRVAVVGLGFGHAFVPIYQAHPLVAEVAACDTDPSALQRVGDEFGILKRFSSLEQVLEDRSIDAVHLLTPLFLHASQSVQVLESGRHCACAVTMGTTLSELEAVVGAAGRSGKNYMMMETGVYTREFLHAREMDFGRITFLRGDYYQDLEAPYPEYWRRVPPMHYATHCLGPIFEIADTHATSVSCLGAGRLRPDLSTDPSNPYPMQVAQFKLEGTELSRR